MANCDGNCRVLAASADNYVIFFLAGVVAYYGATQFLDDRRVLQFFKNLIQAGFNQQLVFGTICSILAVAWLTALEYAIQIFVPHFQISNLAGIPVAFLVVCGVALLSFYVQDSLIASRIAMAVLMPMLQVAALHYYVISNFKQCIPLPMLYILIPVVLGNYIWQRIVPLAFISNTNRPRSKELNKPVSRRLVYEKPQLESDFEYENFHWNYTDHPLLHQSNGDDGDGFR